MDVFSTTPAPFNSPPVGFVCSSFEQVHRGRINNISKGQVEDKRRDGAMTGAFPVEKGGWFFG